MGRRYIFDDEDLEEIEEDDQESFKVEEDDDQMKSNWRNEVLSIKLAKVIETSMWKYKNTFQFASNGLWRHRW